MMLLKKYWPLIAAPIGLLLFAGLALGPGKLYLVLVTLGLVLCVLASVHHAETIGHRVGEPYGTLLLAASVTAIEVALIVSLMLAGGGASSALARDTVFATLMIILNGIIGVCLLLGSSKHGEQSFSIYGVSASLSALAAISILTLILPNFTVTTPGPYYSRSQLGFIAVVSILLYGSFILIQTFRHRSYFTSDAPRAAAEKSRAARKDFAASVVSLLLGLLAVVLLAKALAPALEAAVTAVGAPQAVVGVIIASIILLPEGLSALRAARANRLQTSMNLALGSALASIGLTIPAVALVSLVTRWPLVLGLGAMNSVLLLLSLFVASLSLGTGKTTILQGMIHLVIFAVYLFLTVVP